MELTDKEEDNLIEQMKRAVRWEMDWRSMKKSCPDNERIQSKPDIEVIFEKEVALAILLMAKVIFTNDHWWTKDEGWPEAATKITSLNVNQNDVLMWGAADAHELMYSEIQEVYEYWEKDPMWGTAIWYCKKMDMMPQKAVADMIRKDGIWDIDNMGLGKGYDD